jgi:alkanesulfonate monooxygenase SsuD/methylene tetrahydromethanopterin reductase-like flavin-dependent oxidoreductase (luciferase family)
MLESWTTLSHLAACTDRIRLGTMVTGITHRSVPLLAKIVSTLDVLSGGRAICGLGAGWYEQEHHAYGWPDTSCYPRPIQERIPILVGGSGERRTLRLVAVGADACNLFGEPDVVRRKVGVLRRHCVELGRDPAEVSVSHLSTVLVGDGAAHVRALVESTRPPKLSAERHSRAVNAGTVEQHAARIDRYVESGVDHVVVGLADLADAGAVDRYAAVIDAARART